MVGGLIIVPIVSAFTKKPNKEQTNKLFEAYEEKREVPAKEALD